ncbi:MAG: hypothetical protein CMP51_04425 [Flavobacteriales bacterium]|nr:hypothetical protein [Flavobacteriales bacterium]|tara:strand:- start:371 stop:556 length:186 start_codon:yes stop_codon:yes gene_type:complete
MLEFSKKVLSKVSFDKILFQKELEKSVRWVKKREINHLKVWALTSFSQYKSLIIEVFDGIN